MEVELIEGQVLLWEINPGECFEVEGDVCLRTSEQDPDGDIQVVNLRTGDIHRYPQDSMWTPIQAVIKTFREVDKK